MSLTSLQQEAISARGNVLVVAGAGTGKTHTLVERCLECLLHENPPCTIDQIMMVTFTEAAAAEMRKRVRDRLADEAQGNGRIARWKEQSALFETAHFGTLHSFCLQLVREHFYQLGLDPQLTVLPEEEARLLAEETLDTLFARYYASRGEPAHAVQRLIQTQGRGWDRPIRSMVLRLHHYTQTLPSPGAWLDSQLRLFASPEPVSWRLWWTESVSGLPQQWLPSLDRLAPANNVAAQCAAALRGICSGSFEILASAFDKIASARSQCPRGKKRLWVEPIENFFAETDFLSSLIGIPGKPDPLTEDWGWVREQMTTLLKLCTEFGQDFTEAKRELGMLDFHDLEQYSLQLLWDPVSNKPTDIAQHWRHKLRFILVDEYQDINAAQDQIIQALAREEALANRFLVGDVKQSIYRFRLANPRIFQSYAEQWKRGPGHVLPLVDNFRSKERLLDFINSVFGALMSRDLGGVDYSHEAVLRFGAPEDRALLSAASDPTPAAELHLLLKETAETAVESEEGSDLLAELIDLQDADREARLVGLRLRELHAKEFLIPDIETRRYRPVEWRDMAILLRSPAKKAESYAKEFARLNLPLHVARSGFYQSLEVSDLLSLLQVLDNPLQDLPLLAVLHSPLVGLTANELAEVRLAAFKTPFWRALNRWYQHNATGPLKQLSEPENAISKPQQNETIAPDTRQKAGSFLEHFANWRRLARQVSLSKCLESVLAETHYSALVLTQSRGLQRHANIERLITMARDFDRFQRQGLFRFLRFVNAQKAVEAEPEVAVSAGENAVRLMSIHQSKGLEFPVVVVADLGKRFNLADLRADIILDEQLGLCPRIKPPHTGKRYPSLPFWLAGKRQLRELLSEELRLFYVAMTRARDRLILSGIVTERNFDTQWRLQCQLDREALLSARTFNHWLGLWFSLNAGNDAKHSMTGQTPLLRWFVHKQEDLLEVERPTARADSSDNETIDFDSKVWPQVRRRLAWINPFEAATRLPAKTSVSVLRRQAADDSGGESAILVPDRHAPPRRNKLVTTKVSTLSAADIGNAHHEFLQQLSLNHAGSAAALAEEAGRLQQEARLTPEQVKVLDFEALAQFWTSDLGRQISARPKLVQRELAFTARFSPGELSGIMGQAQVAGLDGEFILVQGIADLVLVAPEEIWLVDFKTDHLEPDELTSRVNVYKPQLRLYSSALERIYHRPVGQAWLYFLSLRKAVPVHDSSASEKA